MSFTLWSLLLALIWMLLFGEFSTTSGLMGLAAGAAVTAFSRRALVEHPADEGRLRSMPSPMRILRGSLAALRLLGHFLVELAKANLMLARDILRPSPQFHPGVVAFDVSELSPREAVLMAAMISLTPGTITIDYERDADTLYVHSIYTGDVAEFRRDLRAYVDLILALRGGRPRPKEGP